MTNAKRCARIVCAGVVLLAACAGTSSRLRALHSADERERARAVSEIARSDEAPPEVLAGIIGALEDPSPVVAVAERGAAASPWAADLVSLLGDADPGISSLAADALLGIGPSAIPLLLRTAQSQNPMFGRTTDLRKTALAIVDRMKPHSKTLLLDMLRTGGVAAEWAVEQIRLAGLEEEEAVPVLLRYLESGHHGNMQFASLALGSFGLKAAAAIPALLQHVDDVDSAAAAGLAGIGEPVLPAVEAMLGAPEDSVRVRAITILAAMRPLPVKRLLELARGGDRELRQAALDSLLTGGGLDLPAMIELSRDQDNALRRTAIVELGRIQPWNQEAGEALIGALLRDPQQENRRVAADAFARMGPAAAPAAAALVQALADPGDAVRRRAAEALAGIGERVQPGILEAMRTGGLAGRAAALEFFGDLRRTGRMTDSVEKGLRFALGSGEPAVREDAAFALLVAGRSGEQEVALAAEALRSPDPAVAGTALRALREAGPPAAGALPALLEIAPAMSPESFPEYLQTLTSVGRRDPRLIPVYLAALRRGEGGRQALAGLAWFDDDVVAPLVGLLKEPDLKDRTILEDALAERAESAITALQEALSDGDVAGRTGAAKLLCRLDKVSPQVVPVLLETLRAGRRKEADWALQCLNRPRVVTAQHADAIAKLYETAGDERRAGLAAALGRCGEAARPHLPLLLAAVPGPGHGEGGAAAPGRNRRFDARRGNLEHEAIRALGELGSISAAAVPVLARWAAEPIRDDDTRQRAAIEALGKIGPAAREAVPAVLPMLDGQEESYQEEALSALIGMGAPPEILVPRCLALINAAQGRLARAALRYLLDSGCDGPGFDELLETLARGQAVRFTAAVALRLRRPPRDGPPLTPPVLAEIAPATGGVELRWGPGVPGAAGYRLFRREEPGGEWALQLPLVRSVSYFVRGVDGSFRQSEGSNEATAAIDSPR